MYLFDHVHRLYKDHGHRGKDFWSWVKMCEGSSGKRTRILIVMAAAYGDEPSGASGTFDTDSSANTPTGLTATQEVSLAPATDMTASLQLTNNEWEELWGSFLSKTALRLGVAVKSFLWSICGGQVSCTTDSSQLCLHASLHLGKDLLHTAECLCWMWPCKEAELCPSCLHLVTLCFR